MGSKNNGLEPVGTLHFVLRKERRLKRPFWEGLDRDQYDLRDFGAVIPSSSRSLKYGFLGQKIAPPAPGKLDEGAQVSTVEQRF